ncbi:MAG: Xaa-Pro aminopeptidase [uncultured Rubrobacteraceae bacterium]|uniref:Xaa-Pro aminopeptidase n=1 Tax=uncultured Rubrobacteraceae bacterium TaxID=349277 RepID=A0A6J4R6Y7_9ACTN|nr:MAG: Xaa-Pro aminopeptidase [uncultured Rubrobacteraceae bacterium]
MHKENDSRTLLVIAASQHDAAAYHLSGFLAPDPVVALRLGDESGGKTYLAVSSMEYGRAKREARADEVLSFDELGVTQLARELKSGGRALAAATAKLLDELGATAVPVAVPPSLGIVYADELRARSLDVTPDPQLFAGLRRRKTGKEISYIEKTQRAVEAACAHAARILEGSEASRDGTLTYGGETLSSERLRFEIDSELLRRGCAADGTIAAGGAQAADPHERGSGPLRAGESIILDIFPVDKTSRYYADMTRTFVKGEPGEELQRMYDAVLQSQEAALAMISPGINGREIHQKVSDVLHEAGYETLVHDQRPGEPLQRGFIHGTGHGVGLEIHEAPRVSIANEELVPGDVITIEPGLYYPEIGGVRIEDLVVVTESSCLNLTEFPKEFRV